MESQAERLIAELRAHGVPVDVRQRLQVERVLALAGEGRSPAELKTLVAPILARSDDEQARIHAILDPPGAQGKKRGAGAALSGKRPSVLMPHGLPSWARAAAVALPLAGAGGWAGVRVYRYFHPAPVVQAPPPATAPKPDSPGLAPQETAGETATRPQPRPAADSLPEIRPRPVPEPGATRARRASGRWLLLIPGFPLLLFGLYELLRLLLRRPAVLRGRDARSPFALPAPAGDAGPYPPEQVRRTAREAARRQRADSVRLSVPASVGATVAAGGWPNLRYQARTRPSEYLALIERRGPRDHQAWLFDELCARLADEGVLLRRYFHDGDPRVCWAEAGGRGISLAELHREHPGHRLLLLGDGAALADVRTGELHPWTRVLAAWGDRALLTPEPVGGWGLREAVLADALPVFPATLDGVRGAVEFFSDDTEPDWYGWWERNLDDREGARPVPVATSKEALGEYLGPAGFRWLGALAVYPELHWRLTRMLGGLPGLEVDAGERRFLRLVRLRWLRRGVIPNADREWLIRELGEKREMAVRAEILKVLDAIRDAAPDAASGRLELDRTVQQLFLYRHDRRRTRKLMRRLRKLPRAQLMEDVAVVRLLEKAAARSPLAVLLPRRFHRFLFNDGIPAFGTRFWARGAVYALAAAALWFLVPRFPAPSPIVTPVMAMEVEPDRAAAVPLPIVTDTLGNPVSGVRWAVEDKGIAGVVDGRVRPVSQGVTRVWAYRAGARAGFDLRVGRKSAALYGVRVAGRVMAGARGQLRPVLPYSRPEWTSCSPILTVDSSGIATARGVGTALVLARLDTLVEIGSVRILAAGGTHSDRLRMRIGREEVTLSRMGESDASVQSIGGVRSGFLDIPLTADGHTSSVTYRALKDIATEMRARSDLSVVLTPMAGDRSGDVSRELLSWVAQSGIATSRFTVGALSLVCDRVVEQGLGGQILRAVQVQFIQATQVALRPLPGARAEVQALTDSIAAARQRPDAAAERTRPGRSIVRPAAPIAGQGPAATPVAPAQTPRPTPATDSAGKTGGVYLPGDSTGSPGAGGPAQQQQQRPTAASWLRNGDTRFANADYAGATAVYDSARALDPAQARTSLAHQGMAYSRRGRWAEGATALAQALAADSSQPDTPWLRLELCAALRLSGARGDTRADKACERAGGGNRDTADIQTALIVMLRDITMSGLGEGQPVSTTLRPGPPSSFRMINRLDPTWTALRTWEKNGTRWTETLPDGTQNFYDEVTRARIGEEEGTVLRDANSEFYVWVPNGPSRGPDGPPLRYQRTGYMMNWSYLGPMVLSRSGRN